MGFFLLPLRAQDDGPIQMKPDLALAIPLLQKGHDVTLKFPVIMNPSTVIKPGMTLRVLYVPPNRTDSEDLGIAHKGTLEQSYARGTATSDTDIKISPELAHEIERERRIIWEVPINFQLALAQLPTDNLHLIYSSTGDNQNLEDQRFNFFEGLFLGSPNGGVSVLAVEIGSKADKAGFKAGDQILSVSGTPVSNDLAAFPALYAQAKLNAQQNNAANFPFVVRSSGESGTHTLNLAMPPTIKSMLMEGL